MLLFFGAFMFFSLIFVARFHNI